MPEKNSSFLSPTFSAADSSFHKGMERFSRMRLDLNDASKTRQKKLAKASFLNE